MVEFIEWLTSAIYGLRDIWEFIVSPIPPTLNLFGHTINLGFLAMSPLTFFTFTGLLFVIGFKLFKLIF